MKIGLIDVDSSRNFPNIALTKISAYHKAQGNTVEWYYPGNQVHYDSVYVSKIFTNTLDYQYPIYADEVIYGGTGYDLKNKLPREIEMCCPDYSLYRKFKEAYGFLTRGCPRNCSFCCVTQKEGNKSMQVADIGDFYRGQNIIKLLDPNLLYCENADNLLMQLKQSNAWIVFTQGIDIRLVDEYRAKLIKQLKIKMIHFAWDDPKEDLTTQFEKVKEWLGYGRNKVCVYVLCGYNSTHEEDLYRIYTLRELGYHPQAMVYDYDNAPEQKRNLARWTYRPWIFYSTLRFEDYDPKKKYPVKVNGHK